MSNYTTEDHTFFISADLGQVNDFTAITITERIMQCQKNTEFKSWTSQPDKNPKTFHLRHIERPARGTTYPNIVDRIKELTNSPQLAGKSKAVVIDITGLGRPVWDLMQNSGFRRQMNGITITGGSTVTQNDDIFSVPKRDLITAMQVAFQNEDLKIAKGLPEADALIKELVNFKVKIGVSGHDTYEAWREGIHDDIVLSAAMGVWLASQRQCRLYGPRKGLDINY